MLAVLLLAVLTLAGGAPAAGALPVGVLNSLSLAVAYTPQAPAPAPQTDRTVHPGSPHPDLRRTRTAPAPAGSGAGGRTAREQQPRARTTPAQPYTSTLYERSPAADPSTHTPRAGIGRAHLTGHAPPPSYEGLLPGAPGPVVPYGPAERVAVPSAGTPSGREGALPGVRGPPRTAAAGPSAGHPSRSAVPASRPR
ncbi:hypothetical protein ACPEIF_09335 [Streptomyces sp. NPDC012600]|uniref:Uncharacterized protein n=1 Tax=Streptomyces stephensoniae TaxID=3375367 RepID=A0ABU2VZT6_9ACTN|nr:hypothetical protein [Streptomyces griseus]MDT0491120.1 hypothetical protein [Streptomyces griseus]